MGAATCRLAAERGYDVAINYARDREAAEGVAKDCWKHGVRAEIFQADVAREDDIARLFHEIDGFGQLTHLVNNAGIVGRASRFDEADPVSIRATVDLNVTGAMLVTQAALKRISTRHDGPGGAIVNLSSIAATLGAPGEYVWYAATKAAIDALTIGLAKEVAAEGVRVNAVSPGLIDTGIHASGGQPDRIAKRGPLLPIGRAGTPQEVAETILFLLSDQASFVTGSNVRIAGGL
ncbi:SDR family oxidoreductase [Flaviflagellibacter deserti]|uniref:SDR family oxidoreductase n=1 Tax=Flaviflagellibacter deserti TaxID=2267266 RepID=A0ABV9YYN3_9HYPH